MSDIDQTASSPTTLRQRFVALRAWLGLFPMSLLLLGMRIAMGAVFFRSGLLKLRSWEFAVKLFELEYQVPILDPETAARITASIELSVPLFLFIGLATRLATLPLLGMTIVIEIFVYPNAWVDHLMWASILIMLMTRGAGAFSADYLIERRLAGARA
jgi:putative oxidoreductase